MHLLESTQRGASLWLSMGMALHVYLGCINWNVVKFASGVKGIALNLEPELVRIVRVGYHGEKDQITRFDHGCAPGDVPAGSCCRHFLCSNWQPRTVNPRTVNPSTVNPRLDVKHYRTPVHDGLKAVDSLMPIRSWATRTGDRQTGKALGLGSIPWLTKSKWTPPLGNGKSSIV